MFALVHDGVIFLKVDEQSAPAFDREGSSRSATPAAVSARP